MMGVLIVLIFSFLFSFVIICAMLAVCSWLRLPVCGYLVVVYGAYFRICLLFGCGGFGAICLLLLCLRFVGGCWVGDAYGW